MSGLYIELDRLSVSVSGVSSQVVEEAVSGLQEELRRVLGTRATALTENLTLSRLELPAIDISGRVSAVELRRVLADRLGLALLGAGKGDR